MKFYLTFLVILVFCQVEIFSLDVLDNSDVLKRAFVNVSKALALQNNLLTVLVHAALKGNTSSGSFAYLPGIPHVVARFENESGMFNLNSNAIVFMDSVASLKTFNNRKLLPFTYSMEQQVIIHFQDGTFDEIAEIKASRLETLREETRILQCEYFVVEEETQI